MEKPFEIDLMSMKEGTPYGFDFHIGREFFEERDYAELLGADVSVHLNVERRHGGYMFEFDLEGALELPCDRCLEPVSVPVDAAYDVMVRHGEEFDDSRDDLVVIPENQTKLDVAPMIYDTILLEIPIRVVHEEGGCNPDMLERMN